MVSVQFCYFHTQLTTALLLFLFVFLKFITFYRHIVTEKMFGWDHRVSGGPSRIYPSLSSATNTQVANRLGAEGSQAIQAMSLDPLNESQKLLHRPVHFCQCMELNHFS
jgi:hypothetical protein